MLLNKVAHPIYLRFRTGIVFIFFLSIIGCTPSNTMDPEPSDESTEEPDFPGETPVEAIDVNYLALGDSYTIGTGVCSTCSYPEQLKDSLLGISNPIYNASVEIIADAGWTTTRLLDEIENRDLEKNFDLVTLLIGVNNQFQSRPFELYEEEFIRLLNQAIQFAKDDEDRVIVISIPDYAYSIFGQNWGDPQTTSAEIDAYNAYAESVCDNLDIAFLNVTDISRQALIRTELLATDGLHLSQLAYSEFVERLLPIVREKIDAN